jgi:hypothetical protein
MEEGGFRETRNVRKTTLAADKNSGRIRWYARNRSNNVARSVIPRVKMHIFFFRRSQKFVQLSRLDFFLSLSFFLSLFPCLLPSRLLVDDDGDDDVTRDDGCWCVRES